MKVINIQDAKLTDCVQKAQRQRVVITRKGKPVAVIVGIKGLDLEQLEVCQSDDFWETIQKRRRQKPISRAELEKRLSQWDRTHARNKARD